MRFLHLADVHLDTPFAGRTDALRRRLREASREALRRALDLAVAEGADAVLIAGDLFDGPRLSFATERFLVDELVRADSVGLQIVYATGNHDPGHGTLRAHRLPWPERAIIVPGREPRRIPVQRAGEIVGWITAAGHESHKETTDLSRSFPRPPGQEPEVALLHTQVRGARQAGEHDAYAPSDLSHLVASGFDYWALGHVHSRQQLSADPEIHYPGNLQGRTPMESGPRGGLLVDLDDRAAPAVEFHAFGPVRWETVRVDDLTGADTLESLVRKVRLEWDDHRAGEDGTANTEWIVRVRLAGPSPLWKVLSQEEERRTLGEELAGVLDALDVSVEATGLHPPVSAERYRGREDTLGEALRLVAEVRDGGALTGIDANDLAGADTLESPHGEHVQAYVRALLEGAEGEVLTRLLNLED